MAELVRRFDFEFGSGWYESVAKTGDIAPGHVEEGVPLYEPSLNSADEGPFQCGGEAQGLIWRSVVPVIICWFLSFFLYTFRN
jgi:hypothetical protein